MSAGETPEALARVKAICSRQRRPRQGPMPARVRRLTWSLLAGPEASSETRLRPRPPLVGRLGLAAGEARGIAGGEDAGERGRPALQGGRVAATPCVGDD